jgi:hypothetical protein
MAAGNWGLWQRGSSFEASSGQRHCHKWKVREFFSLEFEHKQRDLQELLN